MTFLLYIIEKMKKNLFILFILYLFVIQPIIVWLLRNETRAFGLGFINLILIILIGWFYYAFENRKEFKSEIDNDKKTFRTTKEEWYYKHDHHEKPKSHLSWLTIFGISLLVIIITYFFLYGMDFGIKILSISIIWIIIFILFTLIFDIHKFRKFRKLFATKFYIFFIIISVIFSFYQFYQSWLTPTNYLANNRNNLNNPPQKIIKPTELFTWKWEVLDSQLNTGIAINTETQETNSDVIEKATWTILDELIQPQETKPVKQETTNLSNDPVTMMDAIIHLIDTNKIPLINKQDIAFTYVTTKNPYYNYYRTAYSKKMIGTDTNPSKTVACKTYIVMKGLAEWRNVSYTQSTVINNFWNAAVSKDALNGCVKWLLVKENNL